MNTFPRNPAEWRTRGHGLAPSAGVPRGSPQTSLARGQPQVTLCRSLELPLPTQGVLVVRVPQLGIPHRLGRPMRGNRTQKPITIRVSQRLEGNSSSKGPTGNQTKKPKSIERVRHGPRINDTRAKGPTKPNPKTKIDRRGTPPQATNT